VRVGRVVLPTFLVSDYRKVGYANVWVRPPVEVYGLVPVTSVDGLDASYRVEVGGFTSTFQANFGQNDSKLSDGTDLEGRRSRGLTVSAERGATLVRLGYQQTDLRLEVFNQLFDAFRQFGPEGESIADRYDVDGSVYGFYVAGAQYDPGAWFVMAEAGHARSETALGDHTVWYVSGGYRFGRLTPYLTYSSVDTRDPLSDPGLTLAAYPPELRATAAGLNAALNAVLAARAIQDGVSIGARWELSKSFDLKVQFDHGSIGAGSRGRLSNLQPGFALGGSYSLISVAVDFVF
jgi:predicted porin